LLNIMSVILGLVILTVAAVVGAGAVLGNSGGAHALPDGFTVFGYHVTGSTGTVFLAGVVVGAVALFGLSLLLVGARRTSRRGIAARRELVASRRETAAASQDRDTLLDERAATRAETVGAPSDEPASNESPSPDRARSEAGAKRSSRPSTPRVGDAPEISPMAQRGTP
jgi:hypothetical protein